MVTVSAIAEDPSGDPSTSLVRFGGLAEQMCRELAYANGGVFALADDTTTGANLQVFFPRVDPSAEDPGRQAPFGGGETLLIVDRNSRFRQELAGDLKKLGYRVLLAEDLHAAAAMIEIHGSSVDVGVVELDAELSTRPTPYRTLSPLLLYTSHFPWNALRARGVGIPRANFVQKPFSSVMLAERIRGLLTDAGSVGRRKLVIN
jgi:CheY-like chemotaxis protein